MRPQVTDLTTARSFDLLAPWLIDVLGLFLWHSIHEYLYNQVLTDVQSTGEGIKCLYCKCHSETHDGTLNAKTITVFSPSRHDTWKTPLDNDGAMLMLLCVHIDEGK